MSEVLLYPRTRVKMEAGVLWYKAVSFLTLSFSFSLCG